MMRLILGLGLLASPAMAETSFHTMRYTCDRDVMVPATYINAEDQSFVVIHVEGNQITLLNEVAASGARYGWPSDGANYVWWTKGPVAILYWKEGGQEAVVLTCAEAM